MITLKLSQPQKSIHYFGLKLVVPFEFEWVAVQNGNEVVVFCDKPYLGTSGIWNEYDGVEGVLIATLEDLFTDTENSLIAIDMFTY